MRVRCVQSFLTTTGEDVGLCGVDGDAADVVMVSLKHVNSPQGVVVKHTDQHVILGRDRRNDKRPPHQTNTFVLSEK